MIPRTSIARFWGHCMKNLPANKHNVRNWPFTVKSGIASCICVRSKSCECSDPNEHPLLYQRLANRSLIQVSGNDSANFLQGLITNDMTLLDGPQHAMYAMMLNVQGRVLYDLIVYNKGKGAGKPSYLLECDQEVTSELLALMKKYKIRKKVDLFDVSDTYKVWSVLPEEDDVSMEKLPVNLSASEPVIFSVPDPRLAAFSHRLVLLQGIPASQVLEKVQETTDNDFYRRRRYVLGIGEGTTDLPPANSFPLECNAAFLNGVSLSKNCYIGQELTARTHHTGVIRKRLMPFTFKSDDHEGNMGDKVENDKGKNCGKIRNFVGKDGLALLRVAECVGKRTLNVISEKGQSAAEGKTHIPPWWPVETDEIMRQVTGMK